MYRFRGLRDVMNMLNGLLVRKTVTVDECGLVNKGNCDSE